MTTDLNNKYNITYCFLTESAFHKNSKTIVYLLKKVFITYILMFLEITANKTTGVEKIHTVTLLLRMCHILIIYCYTHTEIKLHSGYAK